MSYYGVVLGTFFLIVGALITATSFYSINRMIEKTGVLSYANLGSYYFGKKVGTVIMFFLIFAQFCSCLLYPSVTWQFVSHLLKELNLVDFPYSNEENQTIDETTDLAKKWRLITMVGIFIFIMPFNLQKKLANLRYFSLAILLIVFFTIFVSFIQTPEYYETYKDNPKYEMSWLARSPTIVWV